MEAALALPARFGERSMATKSIFQLTGRVGTRDSNLKRRGWSTQRFRPGVIDQATLSFVAARLNTLPQQRHIRDDPLAGETCFRLNSRIECIPRRCAENLERNGDEVSSVPRFSRPRATQTSKRDGGCVRAAPASRPSSVAGSRGRGEGYNARDSPKPSAICREIHEIERAASGAPREDGSFLPLLPLPPCRRSVLYPRASGELLLPSEGERQRRQRGSARFLGISAGSLGRRVIAAACGSCAPVS